LACNTTLFITQNWDINGIKWKLWFFFGTCYESR
jgi:hypothetical protein